MNFLTEEIMNFLINLFGVMFLWIAVDIGRNEDNKIKFMSKNFWLVTLLLIIGVSIITHIK